jgi:hypothetical protein
VYSRFLYYPTPKEKRENRQREKKRKEHQPHESRVTNGMTNLDIALRSTIKTFEMASYSGGGSSEI